MPPATHESSGQAPAWSDGWCSAAHRLDSPNFGTRPERVTVDLVVIHSISLPPGEYGGPQVLDFFTNRLDTSAHPYFQKLIGVEVSAHFFLRRDGALWQLVSCDKRAWHAGASHYRERDNCNDYSIGIELEGLEGERFTDAQYRHLAQLCQELRQQYPIAHIAGHEHIAPGRKQDPGPGFDWQRLRQALGWPPQCFPEHVV